MITLTKKKKRKALLSIKRNDNYNRKNNWKQSISSSRLIITPVQIRVLQHSIHAKCRLIGVSIQVKNMTDSIQTLNSLVFTLKNKKSKPLNRFEMNYFEDYLYPNHTITCHRYFQENETCPTSLLFNNIDSGEKIEWVISEVDFQH